MKKIKVFAPSTIANVGPGYDVFGLALENIGEELEMEITESKEINILPISNFPELPVDPDENVAGIVSKAMLEKLNLNHGLEISIYKNVKPGSGLGSSGCTAAATAFALNELLNKPFTNIELVEFAMLGEKAVSGKAHADNVAASLLGGFCIIKGYEPLEVINIPYPGDIQIVVVHPQIEVKTSDSKSILKDEIPLQDVTTQIGNVSTLISGLITNNKDWIRMGMNDVIAEPARSILIPGFYEAKKIALENGALGSSISGSGPSIFAFCTSELQTEKIARKWEKHYENLDIDVLIYQSKINPNGCIKIE